MKEENGSSEVSLEEREGRSSSVGNELTAACVLRSSNSLVKRVGHLHWKNTNKWGIVILAANDL